MKFRVVLLSLFLALGTGLSIAQVSNDTLAKKVSDMEKVLNPFKGLKISGWVQIQYQHAEKKGAKNYEGGDFLANSDNRFMIRRGRVKFTYTYKFTEMVLQLNASERGVNLVEFFATVKDPWTNQFGLKAGVMNRPFGYDIPYSSALRETPERSRYSQMLLPNERDLGAQIQFIGKKETKWEGFQVEAGMFNGTGIAVPGTTSLNGAGVVDFDSYKDFIGRIHYERTTKNKNIFYGFGFSHYNGGYVIQSNKYYNSIAADTSGIKRWNVADTINKTYTNGKAPRVYYGVELQFSVNSVLGKTSIRSEYVFGKNAGAINAAKAPQALPTAKDIYVRDFTGFHVYFIQRIGKTKHELAAKYEWYDQNAKVSKTDFVNGTSFTEADLRYDVLSVGYNYYLNEHVKFMFFYSFVRNESTQGIAGYTRDVKDDIFTARLTYRF